MTCDMNYGRTLCGTSVTSEKKNQVPQLLDSAYKGQYYRTPLPFNLASIHIWTIKYILNYSPPPSIRATAKGLHLTETPTTYHLLLLLQGCCLCMP